MSFYPSLEDMQVDRTLQAQNQQANALNNAIQGNPQATEYASPSYAQYPSHPPSNATTPYPTLGTSSLYPTLTDNYMGLSLKQSDLPPTYGAVAVANNSVTPFKSDTRLSNYTAPVSGANAGIVRAEIKQGLRMVTICHGTNGKFGLKLKSIDTGIFVCFVADGSPAALVGIRFGDQIVQINGENCAGMDTDKSLKKLKKSDPLKCELVVRDRPFEQSITMQKDSTGHVGFRYKNGKITDLVKDSSAARNGLLTDHYVCEINGQNVVGMKDKYVGEVLGDSGRTLTVTVMPAFVFDHIIKKVSKGLFKTMDHSIPEV